MRKEKISARLKEQTISKRLLKGRLPLGRQLQQKGLLEYSELTFINVNFVNEGRDS